MGYVYLLSIVSFLMSDLSWTYKTLSEPSCRVLTPVELKQELRLLPTESTPIHYYQYHGGAIGDTISGLAYTLDYYQLPEVVDIQDTAFAYQLLRESIAELLAPIHGDLLYLDLELGSNRVAAVWKAHYQEGEAVVKGVSYLYSRAFYGLQAFGIAAVSPEASMSKYLESFQVLKSID